MKKIYSLFHNVNFYILSIFVVFAFLFTQNYLVSFLAQKYLKESGLAYSSIEGSLLQGIVLHDLKYTDAMSIKRLQVNYNLLYFLRASPKINKIKIDGLYLDVSKLLEPDSNATETSIMSFVISNIELNNTKVIASGEILEFDVKAKEFYYHDSIDIEKLSVDFKSTYANALLRGSVSSNNFKGNSSVVVSESTSKEYLSFLKSVPKAFNVKIEATLQKAVLSTNLENLSFKDDENLSIEDTDIKLTYFLHDNTLEADARYKASYLEFETVFTQTFSLSSDKKYKSKLNASIIKSPTELGFKSIDADIFGDDNNLQANIKAGSVDCNISSKDYKSFSIYSDNEYFTADGIFELAANQELFKALISPKLKNKLYKDYPIELVSPMHIMYKNTIGLTHLNIDAKLLHLKLSKKENHVEGLGTVGSAKFTLKGEVKPNKETQIDISTKIPSIKRLMSELQLSSSESKTVQDGEAEINSTLSFGEIFSMKNDIRLPHYTLRTDSKTSYFVEDIFLSTSYMNKKIIINNYNASYMEQKLYSNKPSTFLIDENANIIIKEFWFQESLHANGFIDTNKKELDIAIKSDRFSYTFGKTDITIQTDLKASLDTLGIQKIEGNIALLEVFTNKEPMTLPFKKVHADIIVENKKIKIKVQAGPIDVHMTSKDYEHFTITSDKENLSLSFLDFLPEQFKNDKISFKAKASMHTSPFSLKGDFQLDDDYFKAKGEFTHEKNTTHSWATLHPKLENEVYKNYPVKLVSPVNINYKNSSDGEKINIDANVAHVTLSKNNSNVEGFGTLGSSTFTFLSKTDENKDMKVSLFTKIPSIKQLLSELELSTHKDETIHDGEVDINTTIVFNDELLIKNDIHIPLYTITIDSANTYLVEDISLTTKYKDKNITLESYSLQYMEQRFYSDKPSVFAIDENENIRIKEFWIFDNLLASGLIDTSKKDVSIHLSSDKFRYEGRDANVSAKADLQVSIHSSGKQKIEGSITLLDGVISYMPPQDYIVTDKDIIVTQDIKAKNDSNRFINVSINSLRPISYKTKDIDIKVTPDIVIYQDLNMPLKLLGMLTIDDGKITTGDKKFVFEKSEVYFSGENPINPQLNLNLHYYTLDHIDIEIFITNTLSTPIVIFSSKPAMSQNDIMSYILFGEASSALFESSDESTKVSVSSLLLGTGLKQIFNDTTGIKVDTFNILSNKEGTLGYEIGTKFSKKIRIVYRSDTVSSVIVQYSLSKSMRVDVDVDESGQGVNIIYIKDF